MGAFRLWEKWRGRYRRNVHRLFFRRPIAIEAEVPFVSFTFDDFPRSALLTGGTILERFGVRGTFYASLGLMGQKMAPGPMFLPEDLKAVLEQGHELGCHTFCHCHSWETTPGVFEGSVIENQQTLDEYLPGVRFRTFSYPISEPRPRNKQRVGRYFACARGGGQRLNVGTVDRNYLFAFFLEQSRGNSTAVKDLIDQNRRARGWLVFVTHDICYDPSPFGCTPDFFEDVVQSAVNSGARILPLFQAFQALTARLALQA